MIMTTEIRLLEVLYRNQGNFVKQEALIAASQLTDPVAIGAAIGNLIREGKAEMNRISALEMEAKITDAGIAYYEGVVH